MNIRQISRAAMIAAIYVSLTLVLKPISYGAIQVRFSEALTVLPIIMPEAIPGLLIGCFLANFLGGLGPWDITLGPLITLLAAIATYLLRKSWLAYLPPIVFNAFGVSAYLYFIFKIPYWYLVLSIGAGQTIAVGLGFLLLKHLKNKYRPVD